MIEKLKSNKKLTRLLTILLFILLCCNLPSLLFFPLCLKEDLFRPPNTEVLVSACKKPVVRGVPGGEVLFVHENLTDKTYLLDLRTGEKRKVPDDPLLLSKGVFLSSELVWLKGSLVGPENPNYRPHYILDLTDGKRYELVDLKWNFPNKLLDNGELNPDLSAYFTGAGNVFIHHQENRLIALAPNFRQNLDRNVIFPQASLGPVSLNVKNGELLEQLMKDLDVNYKIADFSLRYTNVPSPIGKYIVRDSGIYFSETSIPIITREYTGGKFMGGYFKSWFYDESGIVVKEIGYDLINFGPDFGGGYYHISGPILKLIIPIDK
ncbi:MAG: hypothetical protein IT311_04420 [Anaerolineales bacterium]|nr:hypothetical protein [Anaerolineales bacterium]MCZ2120989.1 hypothetical protein [Anaerolineales bacterium]